MFESLTLTPELFSDECSVPFIECLINGPPAAAAVGIVSAPLHTHTYTHTHSQTELLPVLIHNTRRSSIAGAPKEESIPRATRTGIHLQAGTQLCSHAGARMPIRIYTYTCTPDRFKRAHTHTSSRRERSVHTFMYTHTYRTGVRVCTSLQATRGYRATVHAETHTHTHVYIPRTTDRLNSRARYIHTRTHRAQSARENLINSLARSGSISVHPSPSDIFRYIVSSRTDKLPRDLLCAAQRSTSDSN